MDKPGRKMSKSPGPERYKDELDVRTGFADNEKIFLATMKKLFQKYDQPFMNDILINLEDFTYETPAGQHPWDFESNMSDVSGVEPLSQKTSSFKKFQDRSPFRKLVPSDSPEESPSQLSKKKLPTTLGVKQSPDQTCSTLVQYKEDRKNFVSTQNSDLSVLSQTLHVALPLKATVSKKVNRFDMNNSKCFLKHPGRYNVVVSKADDSGPSVNEEASYSDPGNLTLEDIYPQMIESLSRLWDFNIKNQAADNIVRHYKRQFWSKNKKVLGMKMNSTFTISSAPIIKEIVIPSKTYNSTMLPEKCLSKSGLREPIKGSSPILFSQGQKFSSPAVSVTMNLNPQDYARKTFEGIIDNWPIAIHRPIPAKQHKDKNSIMPANCSSWSSSSPSKKYICSNKSITSKSQIALETDQFSYYKELKHLEQNTCRRNSDFSDIAMSLCPKKVVTRPNCNMSERTMSPSKAMTTQRQMAIERNHASYREHTKQLQNRTCTLTRRNSFSSLPVSHSASRDFESLYRNLTLNRTQLDLSPGKAQAQLSKAVSSLVNSPGSQRAKRYISHSFSFSPSKKPRSATESLIGSSKPIYKSMDSSNVSWLESSSSSLHHSS